jgi:hypothetical protein
MIMQRSMFEEDIDLLFMKRKETLLIKDVSGAVKDLLCFMGMEVHR